MSEHNVEDDAEERDDVVDREAPEDEQPSEGEPWAKTSSGDADNITDS